MSVPTATIAGESSRRTGGRRTGVDLNVPYSDKDDAKRLGARWNPERRCWYVPDGLDPKPFARWWITRQDVLSLNLRAPEAYLVRGSKLCWKCSAPIAVIGFLMAPGFQMLESWDDGEATWSEQDDWRFAHYIGELAQPAARFAVATSPDYRLAFSKTTNSRYWANHCPACRRLQGDFNLFCEPDGPFMPTTRQEASTLRATRLVEPFEACGEPSFDVDFASSIPGVREVDPTAAGPAHRPATKAGGKERVQGRGWLSRLASLAGGPDRRR